MEDHQGQDYLYPKEHKTTEGNTISAYDYSKISTNSWCNLYEKMICKALAFTFWEVKLKFNIDGEPPRPFLTAEYLHNQEFINLNH